ncbi:hypothetical protein LCGC14_0811080 [marine sediment metagenome]|uniref:Uncharacterized protein n=1 Tax=marine sediment metagenome TaxID=412755 RepID=A0A0F9Q6X0_9ZZZZ
MTDLGLRTYSESVLGIDRVLDYTYFNNRGVGIAIVARDGGHDDWAAYIGAYSHGEWVSTSHTEEEAVAWACTDGCKLTRTMATRWFPHLPAGKYRV